VPGPHSVALGTSPPEFSRNSLLGPVLTSVFLRLCILAAGLVRYSSYRPRRVSTLPPFGFCGFPKVPSSLLLPCLNPSVPSERSRWASSVARARPRTGPSAVEDCTGLLSKPSSLCFFRSFLAPIHVRNAIRAVGPMPDVDTATASSRPRLKAPAKIALFLSAALQALAV